MARGGVGELIVRLALDASDYIQGLTRAEKDAQKFARTIQSDVVSATRVLKGALAGISVGAVLAGFERAVEAAASFKQLSEQIGDTAEAVGGLQSAALTSGVAITEIASASARLTAALSKTDDESSNAAKAIKALGLNFEEFKQQSPVTQIETVAKALARFEDGAGKTAVAIALFGKAGAQLLPFLNDLADAGGRNARLTQEQIEAADKFTKELARLKGEIALVVQGIAIDMIPAITGMIKEMTEGIRVAGGFVNALRLFGTLDLGGDLPKKIRELGAEIENLEKQKTAGGLFSGWNNKHLDFLIGDAKKKIEFLALQIKPAFIDDAERKQIKPKLTADFSAAKTSQALKERTSEADRYLQSLEQQVQGTLELSAVETALVKIWELEQNTLSGLTEIKRAAILDNAQQIDDAKELKKAAAEATRLAEEEARIRERNSQQTTRDIQSAQREAASIRASNDGIKEQIEFLKGGEEGLRKYTDAKLAAAIADSKHKEAMLAIAGASTAEIEAIRGITAALQETQTALNELDIAKKFADEARNLQDVKSAFADALVDPLADVALGFKSAKDGAKAFFDDLARMLARAAAQNVANQIFGGKNSSGPDFFAVLAKLLSSSGGGGFGTGVELGSLAGGTNNWRGGPTIVGESGPELVNLPRGAQVIPNDVLRQRRAERSNAMTFNINVLPGATTASVRQAKAQLRDAVMSAVRER